MKGMELGMPSRDLAAKILTELDFEHRLEGFELRRRAGAVAVTMYSVEEVVSFLSGPNPRVDLLELGKWIRRATGDGELADQIAEAIDVDATDHERSLRIGKLMEARLRQCKHLMGRA